jgi:hypothetical protein
VDRSPEWRHDVAHIQLLGTGGTIASRSSGNAGSVAADAATDLVSGEYGELRVSARVTDVPVVGHPLETAASVIRTPSSTVRTIVSAMT